MSSIAITGSTDGIGLATARRLAREGHDVVVHGRSPTKLDAARSLVEAERPGAVVAAVAADLSDLSAVDELAHRILDSVDSLDVLINNAGVFRTSSPTTADGLDVRFVVNTLAPYRLARRVAPVMPSTGRIVNLSSAAQAPVDTGAMRGRTALDAGTAYAQSKLALTMWSRHLADEFGAGGPVVVAVNPGSFLATKMVAEGYGMEGHDISTGVDILVRASTSPEFAEASGAYFDNDAGRFAPPHPDVLDPAKNAAVVAVIDELLGDDG
ncbi:MAG: SDR family NAD(P)-dependent oxidoreductase [Actinomycetota bacterium]